MTCAAAQDSSPYANPLTYFSVICPSILSSSARPTHDDRKGHHYYTRLLPRPGQTYIVVMTLAVIMPRRGAHHAAAALIMPPRRPSCRGGALIMPWRRSSCRGTAHHAVRALIMPRWGAHHAHHATHS